MLYVLEFLGLLGIAAALAASPFLIRLLESIVPGDLNQGRSTARYGMAGAPSKERSEMRDEIRRATIILEADRHVARRAPAASIKS